MNESEHPIILFDGECQFCDSTVNFIIKYDKRAYFRFASLQSSAGQKLLKKFDLPTDDFSSFVYINKESYYTKSTAALLVSKGLGKQFRILYYLIIIPRPLRDILYQFIAKNRYKWFGKKEECTIPSPEIRKRFLT
ncbi:thiol-disulfide oxidoreductase DCC family protein [Metabacillus fastidiosus]|uniref:thiol-disulfide oxidoreductase DCC family protein n=1 Tax=Metabacillus fastidiosus TaxID=1458 RepID=UPI002E23E877|nr:thiol-disulfide oxidoreductase DCC family protein [Metabacillus fastidiosus]